MRTAQTPLLVLRPAVQRFSCAFRSFYHKMSQLVEPEQRRNVLKQVNPMQQIRNEENVPPLDCSAGSCDSGGSSTDRCDAADEAGAAAAVAAASAEPVFDGSDDNDVATERNCSERLRPRQWSAYDEAAIFSNSLNKSIRRHRRAAPSLYASSYNSQT